MAQIQDISPGGVCYICMDNIQISENADGAFRPLRGVEGVENEWKRLKTSGIKGYSLKHNVIGIQRIK